MHAVCMHYPEGRGLQFATQEMPFYQLLLLPPCFDLPPRWGNKHPDSIPTTSVLTHPTVKQGMCHTLNLMLLILSVGRKWHLISRQWAEGREILLVDAMHLL